MHQIGRSQLTISSSCLLELLIWSLLFILWLFSWYSFFSWIMETWRNNKSIICMFSSNKKENISIPKSTANKYDVECRPLSRIKHNNCRARTIWSNQRMLRNIMLKTLKVRKSRFVVKTDNNYYNISIVVFTPQNNN